MILIAACSLTAVSCRKNGDGGKAIVNVHVIHDNKNLPFSMVYIAYGATGQLSHIEVYNANDTTDHTGKHSLENLVKGDYYIFTTYESDTTTTVFAGGERIEIDNWKGER